MNNKAKYIDYKYDAKAIIIADADIILSRSLEKEF